MCVCVCERERERKRVRHIMGKMDANNQTDRTVMVLHVFILSDPYQQSYVIILHACTCSSYKLYPNDVYCRGGEETQTGELFLRCRLQLRQHGSINHCSKGSRGSSYAGLLPPAGGAPSHVQRRPGRRGRGGVCPTPWTYYP